MKNIRDKMIDAETRASKWLADGNEAEERGNKAKALLALKKLNSGSIATISLQALSRGEWT